MRPSHLAGAAAFAASLLACTTRVPEPRGTAGGSEIRRYVGEDLLRRANRGRTVLTQEGFFVLPPGVRRVWIDVGAHLLEKTSWELAHFSDVALVAIEPLAECWERWPDNDRLIAIPAAIYLERGSMPFHVNADEQTSSLAETAAAAASDPNMRTVAVRDVPVLRLEDVLAAVPPEVDVPFLKTDVQSVDLQVLQSAGQQLRRVYRIQAEAYNASGYARMGTNEPSGEREIEAYLKGMGFEFSRDLDLQAQRWWLDKEFLNAELSWADRFWQELRQGPHPPSL